MGLGAAENESEALISNMGKVSSEERQCVGNGNVAQSRFLILQSKV